MGSGIKKEDVQQFLQNSKLVDDVVARSLTDPKVTDDLVDEIADKLSDQIEDDPTYTQKLIQAAAKDPNFKKRVYQRLVEKLS